MALGPKSPHEAFVSYFEAHRRDPGDANNLQNMGECRFYAGDLRSAEKYMLQSLALAPEHERATAHLAAVYLRQLEVTDSEEAGADPFLLRCGIGARIEVQLERSREESLRRAEHFSAISRVLEDDNPFAHEIGGMLAMRGGRWREARESFERARALGEHRAWARQGLALVREHDGDTEGARQLLDEQCARVGEDVRSWLLLSAFHQRRKDSEAAAGALTRGIREVRQDRADLAHALFRLLRKNITTEAAAARLRELAESYASDGELLNAVARMLDNAGQGGHAIALLRQVATRAPSDVNTAYRLGMLLSENLTTRGEGRELLERAVELAPDSPYPRRALALLHVDDDPEGGLAILEPILESEDPYAFEVQGMLFEKLGHTADAKRAYDRAALSHGSRARGLLALCNWHVRESRYARAVALAKEVIEQTYEDEDERNDAENAYFSAHRLAGKMIDVLPRLRERIAEKGGAVPLHLAWDVYYGCGKRDAALAAAAAATLREEASNDVERARWTVREAGQHAKAGDSAALEKVAAAMGEDAGTWASLAWAYEAVDRYGDANRAAERAYALDPKNRDALTAMEEAAIRTKRLDLAIACAESLLELFPYEHQGPERLGMIFGQIGRVEEALTLSHRAVDAAPYCHVSHQCRAVALFAAQRYEEALVHARQGLALSPPEEQDADDVCLRIVRALRGDAEGVLRSLRKGEKSEPKEMFAEFKAKLVSVARQRAIDAMLHRLGG
ncbi:MAG TPA: tetratricopeptide repeat protein [Polyangiaceae bacterium]|nr:tetratricopeptide repeat protein [Polyangiaceae bacterium]